MNNLGTEPIDRALERRTENFPSGDRTGVPAYLSDCYYLLTLQLFLVVLNTAVFSSLSELTAGTSSASGVARTSVFLGIGT